MCSNPTVRDRFILRLIAEVSYTEDETPRTIDLRIKEIRMCSEMKRGAFGMQ